MAKITPRDPKAEKTVTVRTQSSKSMPNQGYQWWNAGTKKDLADQLLSTAGFLKEQQQYRYRQAGIYARLYGNMPLFNAFGSSMQKLTMGSNLPIDRPTMNVVQSCVDTLVSRITQSRPRPIFLTDNSDYKERNLAKQMNTFIQGELYQTRAYELGTTALRDASAIGTGCLKIYENMDNRVAIDRVLEIELFVDPNDALYGFPRQMYQLKLVDRAVLMECFPKYRSIISDAEQAYPDDGGESSRSVADQVMVVEGWRLPSSRKSNDGLHAIATTNGVIFDESWTKDKFPFVFLPYSPRLLGFWGQGLSEQLMGTQVEINKLLMTVSSAINLVGVPRVFVEDGSKVVKAQLNNQVGAIITYRGTKPVYEVAPCIPQEVYGQLQRLVEYAYQQSGISALAATSQKPAGLNSGEAIRNYDDLQSDRFAALSRRYDNLYVDLAYQIIDLAKDIADRDGKYQTVYPNKNGTKEIDLPKADLLDNKFVIQCFDASSLPRDPAGRLEKVTEMAQAGMISMQEARRLLDYPDLEQVDKLANAQEERILQVLDQIVEEGKYTPPDPFMDLQLAIQLTTQYYNLYVPAKLEEERAQLLRDFFSQLQALVQAATPPAAMGGMGAAPQALPQASAVSPLLPNAPQG
jgi:hypothetical protein